jgi:single-stranded DNA-binding protein
MLSLCGRVTQDPERKTINTQNGDLETIKFSIVCDVWHRKRKENVPIYYNVQAIGPQAKFLQNLGKGDLIVGTFNFVPWDKDDEVRFSITPTNIHFQKKAEKSENSGSSGSSGGGGQNSSKKQAQSPPPQYDFEDIEDDLPF